MKIKQWQLGLGIFLTFLILFLVLVLLVPGGVSVLAQFGAAVKFVIWDILATFVAFVAMISLPLFVGFYIRKAVEIADEKAEEDKKFSGLVHLGWSVLLGGLVGILWVVLVPALVNSPLQLKHVWEEIFYSNTTFEVLPTGWGIWAASLSIFGYWAKTLGRKMGMI